jgi:hypothetical protein
MKSEKDLASLRSAEQLWTVQDVAAHLRISRAMVYRLPLRFARIGSQRRYEPGDVRLYILNHTERPDTRRAG